MNTMICYSRVHISSDEDSEETIQKKKIPHVTAKVVFIEKKTTAILLKKKFKISD